MHLLAPLLDFTADLAGRQAPGKKARTGRGVGRKRRQGHGVATSTTGAQTAKRRKPGG